jgi:hypothetical protein
LRLRLLAADEDGQTHAPAPQQKHAEEEEEEPGEEAVSTEVWACFLRAGRGGPKAVAAMRAFHLRAG